MTPKNPTFLAPRKAEEGDTKTKKDNNKKAGFESKFARTKKGLGAGVSVAFLCALPGTFRDKRMIGGELCVALSI